MKSQSSSVMSTMSAGRDAPATLKPTSSAAEAHRGGDERRHLGFVRDVAADSDEPVAQLGAHRLESVFVRSPPATAPPSATNRRAIAAPMPEAAPVTDSDLAAVACRRSE